MTPPTLVLTGSNPLAGTDPRQQQQHQRREQGSPAAAARRRRAGCAAARRRRGAGGCCGEGLPRAALPCMRRHPQASRRLLWRWWGAWSMGAGSGKCSLRAAAAGTEHVQVFGLHVRPPAAAVPAGIPPERAQAALDLARGCRSCLVVGSSLAVWSAFRCGLLRAARTFHLAIALPSARLGRRSTALGPPCRGSAQAGEGGSGGRSGAGNHHGRAHPRG
jgi:hypothetical protein